MKPKARILLLLLMMSLVVLTSGFNFFDTSFPEKITWHTHFKADPDQNSPFAALTTTVWEYSYDATVINQKLHIDFNFVAGVDPERSWVKRNRIRDNEINKHLLNHEQGHVYINFLQLKEGEYSLRNQNYTIQNYRKLIQQNAYKLNKKYEELHRIYDKETVHGTDIAKQKKWDTYFQNELRKYPNVAIAK